MSFTAKTRRLFVFGASGNANFSIQPVGNNSFTFEAVNAAGTTQLPITFNTTELNFTKPNGDHYNINTRIDNLEGDLTTQIAADEVLQANINTNTTAINTEVSARVAACSTLTDNIASEITNRAAAITAEVTARDAAIAVETAARIAAVSAEAATRAAAITTLQTSVSNLLSNSDPAVIDSFTESLAAWTANGNTLQSNIDALTSTVTTYVSGINTRLAAIEAMIVSLQGA